ncbi:MAG: hypothetical protein F4Y79_12985 [Gemmatimonadetes bacterium]|nr:hypothetical protein [Gemmatimonadota bacterium]MXZ10345.1 hypothetical protein [Gemmatimonadota bacterium]
MLRTSITLVFCALLIGCGDDIKYQAELRGTWLLESRKPAQGEIIQSPQISGLIEWFPTTPTQAKVHLSVTDDRQSIRVIDRLYDLQDMAFTYQSKLRIGSVETDSSDAVYDTTTQNGTGQISSDDARVTLTHDNGTKYEFIGTQLTITYSNGIVDTWTLNKDQKGVLAK